ncbi:DUF4114 domain-containing protein [aff. Roholtiella sp. LEGE 12411]|uniref:DUF4114 domain-containing protein n=1 Tax=aff. Roholtiella sp. LEGE 12411 TaxID=1828822 RepID=UPI0018814BC7|nr:DUF4114 domain-containing protein [aff. Roholtiella sp. LEGE 12411]MBE9039089.1 DUF4114 domain-containing protein [aff. Roholtiella sp. LEGE 12411]
MLITAYPSVLSSFFKGTLDTTGVAYSVAVVDDYAYVADANSGLQIIDITDPSAPFLKGTFDTTGLAYGVAVAGNYAYIADATSGLQIIDITNPSAPSLKGTFDTIFALNVAVVGNYAYVVDITSGLQIIDITNPAVPSLKGTLNTGPALGVTVVGNYAYVAGNGLEIIDVTDPAAPSLAGRFDTSGNAYGVAVAGNYAYVADYGSGLQIIDITDPRAPFLQGTLDTTGNAYSVAVAGNYAYVADTTSGLQIIDITDPAAPILKNTFDTTGAALGLAVVGKYVYIADENSGLQIIENNTVPTSADKTITINPDSLYIFQPNDFAFNDPDSGDRLQEVKIITLPELEFFLDGDDNGTLDSGEAISLGQVVTLDKLSQLKFKTDITARGDNFASFQFKISDGKDYSASPNNFTINITTQTNLSFKLVKPSSSTVYELGVFTVDDAEGKIGNIAPGATGYTEAALKRAKAVFSAIANIPNGFNTNLATLQEFNSGDSLRFFLVRNNSINGVLTGQTSFSDVIFSSAANFEVEPSKNQVFSLNFQDLVVEIQPTNQELPLGIGLQGQQEAELLDLRDVTQQVKAEFVVNREAVFNNFVGFYRVTDENGGIDINGDRTADILVGQAGYTEAAVRERVAGIDLTVNNQGTATYIGTLEPDSLFAPFIIANGRPDAILDSNRNNDPAVYFPFLGANTDKVDHIRLLGNNTFGFEDLTSGGDNDYNDVIVRLNLTT